MNERPASWRRPLEAARARFTDRQIGAAVAATFALFLTLLLALLAGQHTPPSTGTLVLIAVLSALFQIASGWLFAGHGRADPTLAQASIRRLIQTGLHAATMTRELEALYDEHASSRHVQATIGQLSVRASSIQEELVNAVEDWRLFHPNAVEKAEEMTRTDVQR